MSSFCIYSGVWLQINHLSKLKNVGYVSCVLENALTKRNYTDTDEWELFTVTLFVKQDFKDHPQGWRMTELNRTGLKADAFTVKSEFSICNDLHANVITGDSCFLHLCFFPIILCNYDCLQPVHIKAHSIKCMYMYMYFVC